MSLNRSLRLGTRSSLLAVAQSTLVKRALEQAHPDLQVELVRTDTRGDRDQQTPLTDVKDPDFFSAELDRALLDGRVDLCVHSYKDLDRQRPAGITTAAIPEREQPHDVILFRPDIVTHVRTTGRMRIGSSSLRRQINTGDFLEFALPRDLRDADREFIPLRGPVHERVRRIDSTAADRLDGVVLALAGLNRLWQDPAGRAAIEATLNNARIMVLPLGACPVAHGQGALAIECRADDAPTLELLRAVHDPRTEQLLNIEAALLDEYVGNDSAGFGATAVAHPVLGYAAFVRGRHELHHTDTLEIEVSDSHTRSPAAGDAWTGSDWPAQIEFEDLNPKLPTEGPLFVAHWRALRSVPAPTCRVWTSGIMSWRKLADAGIWVEGCADNLGFVSVRTLLGNPVLGLPPLEQWTALTHADAADSWTSSGVGKVAATYRSAVNPAELETYGRSLGGYKHFYWSSSLQFERLRPWLPADAQHACGAGKTLASLQAAGVDDVQAFISRREWRRWLR